MAITKAKLIADGVITVDNLNASHGIQTTHISEGTNLYYTDARVGSYLTANNYITTAGGYFSDASLSANILTFQKSDGTTDSVDLSLYLDDTNLARLVSGTLDGITGIATFTRDDSSTFTIDFSAFLSDANDYVSSGSFNTTTGVLTLTRLGGSTVTVDLDGKYAEASHTHLWADITDAPTALSFFTNDSGFLTSFTETDPVYVASSWYTTTNNAGDWDTAYGWGDHSLAGYLTSFTETDPVFTASAASGITSTQITNWDTAYGWGNHASAGYLTSLPSHNHDALYVPLSRTITINGTALDLSADRSFTVSGSDNTKLPLTGGTLYRTDADTGLIIQGHESFDPVLTLKSNQGAITSEGAQIWYDNSVGDLHIQTTYVSDDASIRFYTRTGTDKGQTNERLRIQGGGPVEAFVELKSPTFRITSSTNNGRFNGAGDWGTRFYTDGGYIWFGPANTGHAHIYTDRPNFYFNAPLTVAGASTINSGDIRSSIFYDIDNTVFYNNPASTSVINAVNMGYVGGQTYNTAGQGTLFFNANGESDIQGYSIGTTLENYGGNYTKLTIDWHTGIKIGAAYNYGGIRFYNNSIKHYSGTQVFSVAEGDSNVRVSNTLYSAAYRGNANVGGTGEATWHPAGIYSGGTQWLYGTTYRNGATTSGQGWMYIDTNYGHSIVGLYTSTRYQGVFAMGDAYKLPADGSSIGNLYGMTWSHPNAGGVAGNLNTHGLLVTENGSFLAAISGSVRSRDDMRSPIFYDSNDTGYYVDPNSISRLLYTNVNEYRLPNGFAISQGGSNYASFNSWVFLNGYHGFYTNLNGAHFYPNNASYGSWRIDGERNGWGGIHFAQNMTLMIKNTECGFHREGDGWYIYSANKNLYSPGDVTAYWSDRRLKKNIKPINNGLEKILALVPSEFEWNEKASKINENLYDGKHEVSLIAQEVQQVIPDAVTENLSAEGDDEEKYLTIKYDKITPYLIQAIKDQQKQIDELKKLLNL